MRGPTWYRQSWPSILQHAGGSGLVDPRGGAPYMQPVEGGLFGQAVGNLCAALAYDVGREGVCLGAAGKHAG